MRIRSKKKFLQAQIHRTSQNLSKFLLERLLHLALDVNGRICLVFAGSYCYCQSLCLINKN